VARVDRDAVELNVETRLSGPGDLLNVQAYSLAHARALVAAKVAGETIVVGPVSRDGASR
jgi:hypothetical protein